MQLILSLVLCFLAPDIFSDRLFISTYGRNKISSCPKAFTDKVASSAAKGSRNVNGALTLDIADYLRHCILWRN